MGRVDQKVALITGAGRGQGRAHAVRLAEEGASIIAFDICAPVASVSYDMASSDDLDETCALVRAAGGQVYAAQVDVRDFDVLQRELAAGIEALGGLDIVVANAGIASYAAGHEISEAAWQEMIDINLTGTWHTIKAAVPHLVAAGRGGSIVLTSSAAGLQGTPNLAHYVAAKHGVTGLMRTFANELAPHWIRVNSVHPTQVDTPMIMNDEIFRMFRPDLPEPGRDDIVGVSTATNALPVPWVEASDVAHAVLFLASDEARYITGVALPVDAGILAKV
ncbi:mycofactocin-coupled SDR family oxidoreductase [Pimelobacter simplex]|uniref:3-oxoacyl-[acyl-carrier protein] reductase n=1 Tax=Nocardioides simplex TaxID=2045 RepID=A0A0A1DJ36_NOCSI|nr:mycofactocin-coupled SDR family oxidoreductase [Pimelobacter simplex]AIY16677.1 3-oxoacyl-[acyl-carrier protein] reductase [Pimelobacter simplex]MCG8154108.1 mycofactocin-coupled SDR family oxidoreductase [Pimelobacter simplex]GEB15515.1 putative short-chain type dehydrogenase/reductase [Pimelobacter simplex]SFM58756.1 (+)-trans-carveol dehydrogenase [Pimelobacter simplex]